MSQVEAEIGQIPGAVERQLREMGPGYREIGRLLGSKSFNIAISNARGTSDHAATYLKYLLEIQAGIPVASIGPSVVSVYGAKLRLKDQLCVTLSQSGASRDLVLLQQAAALSGATTLAIVNDVASPVARDAELLAPIHAGTEIAVAATKSYVCSLVAIASIVGAITDDTTLLTALDRLPATLQAGLGQDWSRAVEALALAPSTFTLARGPGMTAAAEAALKLKETCGMHAESYSAAEVRHGPIALAGPNFCALIFSSRDKGRDSIMDADRILRASGATVLRCGDDAGAELSFAAPLHPLLDPISQAVSFYTCIGKVAQLRGLDADQPNNLSKVTVTV